MDGHPRLAAVRRALLGTLTVLAIVGASVVGLNEWADAHATAGATTTQHSDRGSTA